jgi:hypothetical protein
MTKMETACCLTALAAVASLPSRCHVKMLSFQGAAQAGSEVFWQERRLDIARSASHHGQNSMAQLAWGGDHNHGNVGKFGANIV